MGYFIDKELYHHGIKGQKWGVRRFQNYDGTRIKKSSDQTDSSKKKGLTDTQKKVLIGTGVTVGVLLTAYGGYKLSQVYKSKQIGNNAIKDILGAPDLPKVTPENATEFAKNINPSHSSTNCGSCSSAVVLNMLGGDYEALPEVPEHMRKPGGKGYDPAKLIECFEGAKWSDRQPPIGDYNGNRRKVSSAIESSILAQGDGAKGIFYCEAQVGNKPGHYVAYAVLDGKIHVLEGQPSSGQSTGIDYHANFYEEVGKLFDVQDGANGVYFARLDNCPVKQDRIKDLAKKRG